MLHLLHSWLQPTQKPLEGGDGCLESACSCCVWKEVAGEPWPGRVKVDAGEGGEAGPSHPPLKHLTCR